jgi:hypothetical protein
LLLLLGAMGLGISNLIKHFLLISLAANLGITLSPIALIALTTYVAHKFNTFERRQKTEYVDFNDPTLFKGLGMSCDPYLKPQDMQQTEATPSKS